MEKPDTTIMVTVKGKQIDVDFEGEPVIALQRLLILRSFRKAWRLHIKTVRREIKTLEIASKEQKNGQGIERGRIEGTGSQTEGATRKDGATGKGKRTA